MLEQGEPEVPPPSVVAQPASPAPARTEAFVVERLADPGELPADAIAFARDAKLTLTAGDLLFQAGFAPGPRLDAFLEPKLASLTQPDGMLGRAEAADRLARAVRAKERVAVFGDYDCDGITACAVLTSALRKLGGDVTPFLATRREGSYGFSDPALERVLGARPGLVVTCDCGSSDHERLRQLQKRGVDVIVIDHHLVPDEPLPALAFLNPHRPECAFPYKGMASCGLALSVAGAVRKVLGKELDLRPLLDLVAIGTVADVAPLTGDNRALVRAGLAALTRGGRPGLRALADLAKLDLSRGVSTDDIAYRIAPRLNAPGRLADPDDALALLLEASPERAQGLAAAIEHVTQERRVLQEKMIQEATQEIEERGYLAHPALVLARESWHPGIVGIVAGRLATTFGRPTIVVGLEGSVGRGSVRGPRTARLYDGLAACAEVLEGFGGHQVAAGLKVHADKVDALRDRWNAVFEGLEPAEDPTNRAGLRLDPRDEPEAVGADLERIEPTGEGNPAATLFLGNVPVLGARSLKGHLKLELGWGRRSLPGFAFFQGELAPRLAGARLDVVARLRPDKFRGGRAVELSLLRVAVR